MTKRIFRSIFTVTSTVLLASLILIIGVLYDYFATVQENTLRTQTQLAVHGVENQGPSYFDGLKALGFRLTWVDADGTVLYDSQADASSMENHAYREEIKKAIETGLGESERTSATLAEKTLYRAVKLSDGTVLRGSMEQYTVLTLAMGIAQPVCVVLVLAIILASLFASRLSKRIVQPLNSLDLDNPLENEIYEELAPLLTRIESQHRQISSHLEELQQKQDEFAAVTGSMNEGLILLNSKGGILSINNAAMSLFNTDIGCIGENILTVDRSTTMQKLVSDALGGRHSEAFMELAGSVYQVDSSPTISGGKVIGACILAIDVTEKAKSDRQRREFSANVSHELKSPLHSIMGSAELIESGLAKPEDVPRFVGHIRSEASRLLALIDDIIRLSQLDEGVELPDEDIDLMEVVDETVSALADKAREKGVCVDVRGERLYVRGVRRLLHEIVYNLCDNGIKYNVPGGKLTVSLSKKNVNALLTVSDTGIGIPPEDRERVFERFFRVDKSHSKQTGGTGLGLSIVKHAAQYLGAKLELKSKPGQGTTIRVWFPGLIENT